MINKFYVADLAPGRSMVEYFGVPANMSSRSRGATRPRTPPTVG